MSWKPGTQRRRRVPGGEGGGKRPEQAGGEACRVSLATRWPHGKAECSGLMRGMTPKDGVRKQRRKDEIQQNKVTNKQAVRPELGTMRVHPILNCCCCWGLLTTGVTESRPQERWSPLSALTHNKPRSQRSHSSAVGPSALS